VTVIEYAEDYVKLLQDISEQPVQVNGRTGQRLRVLPGGAMLKVDLLTGVVPIPMNRKYRPYVAAAEAAWILSRTDSTEWISSHCKIWDKFAINGKIKDSYGSRIGPQLDKILSQLELDKTTRRAVINLWDIKDDNTSLNAPCPTQVVLSVDRFNELNMSVFMRSSDVFVGLPYDIMTWSLILDAIAAQLKMNARFLTFFLAHPHIYEAHQDYVQPGGSHVYLIDTPGWNINTILADKDNYVGWFKSHLRAIEPPNIFDPKPEVFE